MEAPSTPVHTAIRNRDSSYQWDPAQGIPAFRIHTSPLKKKRRANTTRDDRRDIKMAHRCGKSI
jgi:hypothetical protein